MIAAVSLLVMLLPLRLSAQAEEPEPDPYVSVSFVIVRSTTDYSEAHRFAQEASSRLGIPLDLRGLIYDPKEGLTWPRERCEKDPFYPYPCYVARGRFDAGVYLSVERSDAYVSFRPGLFVVIAASGPPGSPEIEAIRAKSRSVYPDAYARNERVYHGCMH